MENCIVYNKWNYITHSYDDYFVPMDKVLVTWSGDLNDTVNCCQCLKEINYGDSYTSLEVHTAMGMGYAVCEDCYNQEWIRRMKFQEQDSTQDNIEEYNENETIKT